MEPPRVNEVINIINSLNLNKSVGHDNISPYFLRVASDTLAPALSLTMLFDWEYFQQVVK